MLSPPSFSAAAALFRSKLCNQVFTYVLSDRLQKTGSPVTCNALDPGTVNTKMLLAGWGPMGIDVSGSRVSCWARLLRLERVASEDAY